MLRTIRRFRAIAAAAVYACCSFACWNHPLMGVVNLNEEGDDQSSLLLALLGGAGAQTLSSPAFTGLLVFRTASNYNGNMLGGAGGVTDADSICAAEATAFGYSGTYKALLGTEFGAATPRFACRNAFCSPTDPTDGTNWVLTAEREYYRATDGAFIGATTANRIFNYPLSNSLSEIPGPGIWHWGGVFNDWRPPSGAGGAGFANNDFNGWIGTSGNGWIAYSYETNNDAFFSGTTAGRTNPNMHLVCVQQP